MSEQQNGPVVYDFEAMMSNIYQNVQTYRNLLQSAAAMLSQVSEFSGAVIPLLDTSKVTDQDVALMHNLAVSVSRFNDELTNATGASMQIESTFRTLYAGINANKAFHARAMVGPYGTD